MHNTRISLHVLIATILTMHCGAFDRIPSWQVTPNFLKEKGADALGWLRNLPTNVSKQSTQKFFAAKTCVKNHPVVSSGAGLLFLAGVTAYWNRAAIAQTQTWQKTSAYVGTTTQEIKKRLLLCWGTLTGETQQKHQKEVDRVSARAEHLDTTVGYLESDIVKLQERLDESEIARREMFEKYKKEVDNLSRDKAALQARLDERVVIPQHVPHIAPQQQTQPATSQEGNLQITTTSSSSSSSEQESTGFGFVKEELGDFFRYVFTGLRGQ